MYNRILKLISQVSEIISVSLLGVLTFIIILQVFFRTVLGSSLSWSNEFGSYLLAWVALFGAVTVLYEGKHIAINMVVNKFKDPWYRVTRILANIFILLFALSLIYFGIPLVIGTLGVSSISLDVSKGVVYSALPISALLMTIIVLNDILKDLNTLLRKQRKEEV